MLFEITEKQILALKAVVYGCNTNRRLVGATFVAGVGSESEQTISFYEAIRIADDLLEQPAVDAVPVVRCKDCIYCDKFTNWNKREYWGCQRIPCEIYDVDPDHFCSYGERKDGDTNG